MSPWHTKCTKCMLLSRSVKVPVTLSLVAMSTVAYLEWHRPPPTLPNKRSGHLRGGLVIEPIFSSSDDAAEAPMAILAEPPLWRTWPHKAVMRAPGRHCAWAPFTPPRKRRPPVKPPRRRRAPDSWLGEDRVSTHPFKTLLFLLTRPANQ